MTLEIAAEFGGDNRGAQAVQHVSRGGRVAHQRGHLGASQMRELDRHPADPASRAGDQHPLAQDQAADLQHAQRRQPGGGQRGGLDVGHLRRDRCHPVGRHRGQLRPRPAAHQPGHPGPRRRPTAIGGRPFDDTRHIPASRRPRRLPRQVNNLTPVQRRGHDPDQDLTGQGHRISHLGQRHVRRSPNRPQRKHHPTLNPSPLPARTFPAAADSPAPAHASAPHRDRKQMIRLHHHAAAWRRERSMPHVARLVSDRGRPPADRSNWTLRRPPRATSIDRRHAE